MNTLAFLIVCCWVFMLLGGGRVYVKPPEFNWRGPQVYVTVVCSLLGLALAIAQLA